MNPHALVYPMFAMVLWTFVTLLRLFTTRMSAVREGTADPRYFRTYREGSEPEAAAQLSRNFVNLFEAPILFYVGCLAAMAIGLTSTLTVALAWLYVALRAVHSWIHTGSNALYPRIGAYFASWVVLLALWASVVAAVARSS